MSLSILNTRANNLLCYLQMIFYKGVLCSFLDGKFIPGTVTINISEALVWAERIGGKKTKGACRHIKHGKSCIIQLEFDESLLLTAQEFQRAGVKEHNRLNCWTSEAKTKAQINNRVKYSVLTSEQVQNIISAVNYSTNTYTHAAIPQD